MIVRKANFKCYYCDNINFQQTLLWLLEKERHVGV